MMTKQELNKLFEPLNPNPVDRMRDPSGTGIFDNLYRDFKGAAIFAVLDLEQDSEEQKTVLNHLWRAYVIAMGCHGWPVLPAEFVVKNMEVPNLSKFADFCRASGDGNDDSAT